MSYKQMGGALLGALIFLLGTLSVFASDTGAQDIIAQSAVEIGTSDVPATVYQIEDTLLTGALTGGENAPVLKDVRGVEQGNQTLIIKTWDVSPGYDAEGLVEADFEKGGLFYKKAYLLQMYENYDNQTKLASETVTVTHDKKDDAIAKLLPIIEYSEGGFSGQLTLKADAIVTEAADKNSYSYAVTDTREFTGLERNDPYNIPKAVDKDGIQLQLVDLSWTQRGEGNYSATASYRGTASGTAVSSYISTATYLGEVSKSVLDSVTYAVVYEGSLIPPPPTDYLPYLLIGSGALLLLVLVIIFLNRRDNTKVYAMTGKEYQLVHKQRVTSLAPIIDLSPQEISSGSQEFMIVLDRLAARKLRGQFIKVIGKDGMMQEHRVYKVRSFRIEPNQNETQEDY